MKRKTYQNIFKIVRRATVCIGSLYNTNVDRVDTSCSYELDDEHGCKTGNLVTIKQFEDTL